MNDHKVFLKGYYEGWCAGVMVGIFLSACAVLLLLAIVK